MGSNDPDFPRSHLAAPDPRLTAALVDLGLPYEVVETQDVHVTMATPGGRGHTCLVESRTFDIAGVEMRQAHATAFHMHTAPDTGLTDILLRESARLRRGFWSLEHDAETDEWFAVVRTKFPAKSWGPVLLGAIHFLTHTADAMEERFTGRDDY